MIVILLLYKQSLILEIHEIASLEIMESDIVRGRGEPRFRSQPS
jgi:hypothetical protein